MVQLNLHASPTTLLYTCADHRMFRGTHPSCLWHSLSGRIFLPARLCAAGKLAYIIMKLQSLLSLGATIGHSCLGEQLCHLLKYLHNRSISQHECQWTILNREHIPQNPFPTENMRCYLPQYRPCRAGCTDQKMSSSGSS